MKFKFIYFEKIIKINKVLKYAVLTVLFSLFACVVNAQAIEKKGIWDYPGKPGLWDYPVKPGTEEWKKFRRTEEMVRACQIPEKILSSLSTEDLTDLCLRYPLLADFFAFQNTNEGLDILFSSFNGIRELYKRKDVSSNLTRQYADKIKSFDLLTGGKVSGIEKGFFVITVSALEVLISRIDWQNSEGKESSKEVLRTLVTGYEEKCKYPEWFRGTGFITNSFARAHIISKMEPTFVERLPQKGNSNALYSGMVDQQEINLINEFSYQLIK